MNARVTHARMVPLVMMDKMSTHARAQPVGMDSTVTKVLYTCKYLIRIEQTKIYLVKKYENMN
jgi:hypothetical protein